MRSSNRNRNKLLPGSRFTKTQSETPKKISTLLLMSVAITGVSIANVPIISAAQPQLLASVSKQFATPVNNIENQVAKIDYADNNSVDPANKDEQKCRAFRH